MGKSFPVNEKMSHLTGSVKKPATGIKTRPGSAHQAPFIPTGRFEVRGIGKGTKPLKIVHDPSHPDADKDGNVAMPNINVIEEMVNMMMASRAYEASITTFNTANSMVQKTLELGRFRCRI